ncbi:uncharacterized protein [Watersipora subatra]|uniref:uncharacterized protein isoform X4 n=1 Tax=Watersipora subatra TaxID=2589382 RepID=UPI00355AE4B8
MACKVCHALKCQNCPSLLNDCENGTSHTLLPLNHLISMMFDEKIRQQMTTREKSFEALFKEASRVSAIEAVRTADMVDLIHQISNDQERRNVNVPQLKSQYKKMEDRVLMSGQRSQSALSEFMDVVLRQWQQLCNQRQHLEWRFKRSVPSETLSEWNEFDKIVEKFTKKALPTFVLAGQIELSQRGLEFPLAIMEFNGYILLTQRYQQSISILNGSTGFHVQALYDKELANVYIYSLAVSGTTLLVPKFGQEKLILYQLEMSER